MAEVVPLRVVRGHGIEILDQTLLPLEERYVPIRTLEALCEAIRSLRVRGAPLLGVAGACGLAIAAETDPSDAGLELAVAEINATRPTAVDLGAMTLRALRSAQGCPVERRAENLWRFAESVISAREAEDRLMGEYGADLVAEARAVLTHCNTGALATGGRGTALGVIRCAWESGSLERCYVTETRPLLQGARLTAWELTRLGIPSTLLPDTAMASLLASGQVAAVITGADRIAANGDTANKVGTYGLAAVAAAHGVPFYVAAPRTTFDPGAAAGSDVPIEYRDPAEVGGYGETRWAPPGVDVYNPAFDVTPAALIAAFVTERGVLRPPFAASIAAFCDEP